MSLRENEQTKPAARAGDVWETPVIEIPAQFTIRIAGNDVRHLVSSVTLHESIDGHHVLEARVKQIGAQAQAFADSNTHASFLGESLAVSSSTSDDAALEFIGVVTNVGLDNSVDGMNTVLITAHSPTIALDGAKKNAFFVDSKASDIVSGILGLYSITVGDVQQTDRQYPYTVQYRETDYEFIMRLADMSGMFAFYNGREFRFAPATGADAVELVWIQTLGRFSLRLGASQVDFNSDVYNYEQKRTYSQNSQSLASPPAATGLPRVSPAASQRIFRNPGFAHSSIAADARSLDRSLERARNRAIGLLVPCKGQSTALNVAVGRCIRVAGMDQIGGVYWVTSVRHVFADSGKYHNVFECTPLDYAFPTSHADSPEMTHLQSAVVVDNNDPEGLGRVKVQFPWSGDASTCWARCVAAHAGKDRGHYCIPEVSDEVLVGFEFGRPNRPIVIGSLFNSEDAPVAKAVNPDNNLKVFTTRSGNELLFQDENGKEEIRLTMKDGKNQIILAMQGPSITIQSDGDITIKGKNISIESSEKFTVKASQDAKIKTDANLSMESAANAKMKSGGSFDLEGATVKVKGATINLN